VKCADLQDSLENRNSCALKAPPLHGNLMIRLSFHPARDGNV
jgi:hypothetical protein